MAAKIPIRDTQDRLMGTIVWVGSMSSGTWRVVLVDKLSKNLRKQITELPAVRVDLAGKEYRSPRGVWYPGWSGFPGLLGALRDALPGLGLDADPSGVEWPPYIPYAKPIDVDVDGILEDGKKDLDIEHILREKELIFFRRVENRV